MRLERGQHRGRQDYGPLFLRTMRYSLRRALSLDSVDGGTHNPKVGGSNPPPRQPLDSTGCEFRVEQTDSQSTHKVSRVRIGAPCFTLCSRRYCCQPIEQQLPDDHRIRCSLLLGDCLRVHLKRGLRKGLLLTTTVSSLNAFSCRGRHV